MMKTQKFECQRLLRRLSTFVIQVSSGAALGSFSDFHDFACYTAPSFIDLHKATVVSQ